MSKMFSVVTLDASHSLMTEHFVPGSPDGLDELLDCDEISEVLAEWPLGDTIEAKIQTYLYGDGETVRADEEDLAFFREHFDELDASDALDCISDHSFSFESDELDFGYAKGYPAWRSVLCRPEPGGRLRARRHPPCPCYPK